MIIAHLKAPLQQKEWRWPAVANFVLGGTGAGFYLIGTWLYFSGTGQASRGEQYPFGLISSLLIFCGFVCLSIEAGRPLRGWYLFRHLRRSWISRETIIGCLFMVIAIAADFSSHPILKSIAAIFSIGFLISQGFIVYRARAITAWNTPLVPLIFLFSGLVAGYGLILILIGSKALVLRGNLFLIGLILLLCNLVTWLFYLWKSQTVDFSEATKVLRRPVILIFSIGLNYIIPFILLFFLLIHNQRMGGHSAFETLVMALSGVLLLTGNMVQKAGMILVAGYYRGIELHD